MLLLAEIPPQCLSRGASREREASKRVFREEQERVVSSDKAWSSWSIVRT
jgi:hypothetical protein